MSSPTVSVSQVLNDVVGAILSIFDALAQAVQQYAPWIIGALVVVAVVSGVMYAFRNTPIVRRILGFFGF
jgi:type III secretory pathway component EscS